MCAPLSKFEIRHSNSNVSPTEFPRSPTGIIRQHIAYGADDRLKFYLPVSAEQEREQQQQQREQGFEVAARPRLLEGVVGAPLVRVFNYLRGFFSFSFFLSLVVCVARD